MSSFTCPQCGTDIIDSETGYITGCPHYPKEDLAKLPMGDVEDGMSIDEGDKLAIYLLKKQNSLA